MKILSIDPGYERLGIAILEKKPREHSLENEKEVLVFSKCFKTSAKISHAERLSLIKNEVEEIIKKYKPKQLAIETLFFSSNQKTAFLVAEARGVVISVSKSLGLDVFEYGPGQIKLAITGYGKSDKNAIIRMIPLLISIENKKVKIKYDDEYDAIAVGITHFAINKNKI